jgi:hypothetical protein
MVRKKTSIIWKIEKEYMEKIVQSHDSLAGILRYLGLSLAGNYKTLKKKLEYDNIDYENIKLGLRINKKKKQIVKSISEYLVNGSSIRSGLLKKILLEHNMLENKCSKCGQIPEWNGESLTLQLDHINGISTDNRIENLRILCPNCHTQTPTFAGRQIKKHYNCSKCYISLSKKSEFCQNCKPKNIRKRKIQWPENNELIKLTNEFGFCAIGRKLGVSDKAIKKHIKRELAGAVEVEST